VARSSQVGLGRLQLLEQRDHLGSLDGEIGIGLVEGRALHRELAEQLAVGGRDLLCADHPVHEVVERVRGQDELDVVHRSVVVYIAQPLVQQLIAHAHLRM
jgi:hypothetical protein